MFYSIFSTYLIFPNNYCYPLIICDIIIITLIRIRSHICSFILLFSYFFAIHTFIFFFFHLVVSSYHICDLIIYHVCIYAFLYSYVHVCLYIFICLYLFISLYIIYAFLSRFSYSCIFYISIMYTSIHSCIHIYS